jgi:hypothetical protein
MKHLKHFTLLLFISFSTLLSAQTAGVGSLAFIAFQNNAPDGFAVVLLEDFPGNQVIFFTDNGWSGTELFSNEQTVIWTLPSSGLPAGTTVRFRDAQDDINTVVTPEFAGTTVGVMNNLSAAGEQILAYTGGPTNLSFIAGISSSNWLDICNTSGSGNTNTTCLPAPLENGVNAFAFTNTSVAQPNGFFNVANFTGTPEDLLATIMNVNNWTLSAQTNVAGLTQWPAWDFNLGSTSSSSIVQFPITSNTVPSDIDPFLIEISTLPASPIDGFININYVLSEGLNNTDFSIDQTVSTNAFSLPILTSQSTASFTITFEVDLEISSPQTITFIISNTSDDALIVGSLSSYTLTINPAGSSEAPLLYINEFMAQNSETIADENGEFDDWIEIYNPNNFEIDLAGLFITDDLSNKTKYEIPFGSDDTKIPANGFKLIWADNQTAQGVLHTNFALSVNGEAVGLYASDGETVIDEITFGPQQTDVSYGRQRDGETPWVLFNNPTPGASNNPTSIQIIEENNNLVIYPNPSKTSAFMFWKGETLKNVKIAVYDINGSLVAENVIQNIYQNTSIELPIQNLNNGVYFLNIQNQGVLINKRFVVNR